MLFPLHSLLTFFFFFFHINLFIYLFILIHLYLFNFLLFTLQYTNNPLLNDPAAAIVKRASNAHQNALENLPFIIGGVLMAKQARLPSARINRLALIHFICRLLYVPLYVWTTRQRYSYIRTLVYTGGLAASLALMVEATLA